MIAWNRPYDHEVTQSKNALRALLFGLFVFAFLVLFQPFGINTYPGNIVGFTAGYGLVTTVCMLALNNLLPWIFSGSFDESRWTVGREMVWTLVNVLVIALGNILYTAWAIHMRISLPNALVFLGYTLSLAIFPVLGGILFRERHLRHRYEVDSEHINAEIRPQSTADTVQEVIIPSQNQEESFAIRPSALLFVKSDENYCDVHFWEGTTVQRRVVRSPLSAIEEAFSGYPAALRCHRSYVVNLHSVGRLSGNAQGFRLHLEGWPESIPVSRKLNGTIRALLRSAQRS
jgi:hypothetical protein